ncbi:MULTISPECIES: MBOAT family protein [unclassified Bacillus (in: firmicutes)]|uniref:MBOAT family O-acyltransferase n=1 Tax=unclassified Bacillus (in: firmicutes) TaxID=185979 RepID=UPI0008ED8E8D|nr:MULTISPECIES: MBOAT family protein [unclassified Bacillus (in: firmicutes)]SFB04474.1 alginate O-acetyltransferase complex protein AlgI [Bacillus sp. UNCCL13]SFQ88501.1 alginate O-acetyltransferase complex protein AlgI [Bacillus sp. cl95]
MVFSNLVFLFIFLPLVLFSYFLIKREFQNYLLLAFSLFFYAWGEPKYVAIMLLSLVLNYLFGLIVHHFRRHKHLKKITITFAVITNLLLLGYYKYINFIILNINELFSTNISIEPVEMPLGISFFTFHAMSYVIDVYRKEDEVQRNPFNLALYLALFPQLIAGPIIRYHEVADQIKQRFVTIEKFSEGIRIFIIGLSKKVLIANQVGFLADAIFNKPTSEISVLLAWIGIIAYTLQIYFDFSGYSDMAIGLGKMFGFDFPKNFNYPYISKSISEFWRRWHISLSSWFRDYVYIPLGGNRVSTLKSYRNLFIVWGLTGLWHGASWTFIAWGLYYGIIIAMERAFLNNLLEKLWTPLRHVYVILIFLIGWVFFRADNFTYSFEYIQTMFGLGDQPLYDKLSMYYLYDYGAIMLLAIVACTPIMPYLYKKTNALTFNSFMVSSRQLVVSGILILLLLVNIVHMVNSTFNPFIYFRF